MNRSSSTRASNSGHRCLDVDDSEIPVSESITPRRRLRRLYFVLLAAFFIPQSSACSNPDSADVQWRVAGDNQGVVDDESSAAFAGSFEGFFTARQTASGVSTSRSLWWDGRLFRQYRNEQLIAESACRAVPLDERKMTLRCDSVEAEQAGGTAVDAEDAALQGGTVVPLQALDANRIVHRAMPQVIYTRMEVPAVLVEQSGTLAAPQTDNAGAN